MNYQDFETAKELLTREIAEIAASEYLESEFGSWFVEVATEPRMRLLWDGKDGWLSVERKTDKTFNGLPVWDELWTARRPEDAGKALQLAAAEMKSDGL